MATTTGLMGLGVPAEMAKRVGVEIVSVTTTAATQNSAGGLLVGPGNKVVLANVAGASGAVTLPAAAELGDEVEIYNRNITNGGLIFPHTGGSLNGGAPNANLALPVSLATTVANGVRFRKVSATLWLSIV